MIRVEMRDQNNIAKLQLSLVMQTPRQRLMFDYFEIDPNWSKAQVMETLRSLYYTRVHGAAMTEFQRVVLCQDMIIEIRDMSEVVFDDEEAQVFPTRVFVTPGNVDQALTQAFNYRNPIQAKRAFRNIYPSLVASTRGVSPVLAAEALVLRKSLNRRRAVVLQFVVLAIMVAIGVGVGIAKQNAELGPAIGGALFALATSVQAAVLWVCR